MGYLMPPRIRFLIPYFGRWPFWMPFFIESCRKNPDVEWLFFSDCGQPDDLPHNVSINSCSFADYCSLVSDRLGIEFSPDSAYKLCDIKPALGYIHADQLVGFDFWGFSDIDLVYGDLRGYFTAGRLARYDLLSTHERRISGHLCLLRNNEHMRTAFMQVSGWRNALSNSEHCAFDEKDFSRLFIRRKNWPEFIRRYLDRMNNWRRQSEFAEAFSTPNARVAWRDGTYNFPERWVWRDGRLTCVPEHGQEFPYFHFIAWKAHWKHIPSEHFRSLAKLPAWSVSALGFHGESR